MMMMMMVLMVIVMVMVMDDNDDDDDDEDDDDDGDDGDDDDDDDDCLEPVLQQNHEGCFSKQAIFGKIPRSCNDTGLRTWMMFGYLHFKKNQPNEWLVKHGVSTE